MKERREGQEGAKRAQMVIIIACGAEKKVVVQYTQSMCSANKATITNNRGERRDGRRNCFCCFVVVVV